MKTLIAALAAVATVTAVAAPAVAQPYRGHDRYEHGWTSSRVQTAEIRIESGLRSGQLTRREASRLRAEVDEFARLEAEVRRGRVSGRERAYVERRWDRLVQLIRYETRDREYGYGYGRGRGHDHGYDYDYARR